MAFGCVPCFQYATRNVNDPSQPGADTQDAATSRHCPFATAEVADLQRIREVAVPVTVKFRQIIVTGPPCSGKSTLVKRLGGWPEEGYLDLAQARWWTSRILTFRPREVHFGIPFENFADSHAVFDPEWVSRPSPIDFSRIRLPPPKRGRLSIDWRARYTFDFQLPPPGRIYAISRERMRTGTPPIDTSLTLELVQRQVSAYAELAGFFHRNGMLVWVRDRFDGPPLRIVVPDPENAPGEA